MKHFLFMLFCALTSAVIFAQEGSGGAKLDVNITKNDGGGGNIPWLWIIGGIVFVVLLIALLGGGRDRVVEKRTVIKK